MAASQRKQAALQHLLRDLLGLRNDDSLPQALIQRNLTDIDDDVFGRENQGTMDLDVSMISRGGPDRTGTETSIPVKEAWMLGARERSAKALEHLKGGVFCKAAIKDALNYWEIDSVALLMSLKSEDLLEPYKNNEETTQVLKVGVRKTIMAANEWYCAHDDKSDSTWYGLDDDVLTDFMTHGKSCEKQRLAKDDCHHGPSSQRSYTSDDGLPSRKRPKGYHTDNDSVQHGSSDLPFCGRQWIKSRGGGGSECLQFKTANWCTLGRYCTSIHFLNTSIPVTRLKEIREDYFPDSRREIMQDIFTYEKPGASGAIFYTAAYRFEKFVILAEGGRGRAQADGQTWWYESKEDAIDAVHARIRPYL